MPFSEGAVGLPTVLGDMIDEPRVIAFREMQRRSDIN